MVEDITHGESPTENTTPNSSRRRFLAAAGGLAVGGLAGCVSNIGGSGASGTVNYGVLSPISGAYSGLGPGQRRGAKLAIEQVNNSNEFEFTIDATYEDTATSEETGRQVAQKAVQQDNTSYLMGAISSSTAIAINDLAESEQVIYNPGAAAVPITGSECNEYVFRAETNTAQIAEAVSDYTVNNLGRKVWFHIADYAYGESVLNRVRSRMKEADANLQVVGTSKSQLGASNYDSFISDIANSDVEVAVLGMTGGDLINFVNQANSQGLKEQVNLMAPTMTFSVVRAALGPAAVGTYGGVRYLPDLKTGDNRQFVDAYREKHDSPPDNFARVAYQSIRMTAHGITEAGSTDPMEVKDSLTGLEMKTILGPNRFRNCDHQAENPTWMGELVAPKQGKTADVKLLEKVAGKDAILPCNETGCSL